MYITRHTGAQVQAHEVPGVVEKSSQSPIPNFTPSRTTNPHETTKSTSVRSQIFLDRQPSGGGLSR